MSLFVKLLRVVSALFCFVSLALVEWGGRPMMMAAPRGQMSGERRRPVVLMARRGAARPLFVLVLDHAT